MRTSSSSVDPQTGAHLQQLPGIDALVERLRAMLSGGRRVMLGLVGPPAAGKSTLAEAIVSVFSDESVEGAGPGAALVPMDGFHLANEELARLGRADRKGAPDTFDAAGYLNLLQRLRQPQAMQTVYAPRFDRGIEQAIAGAIAVRPACPLVVTEGNYLLLDQEPWAQVPALLDETWYVELDETVRLQRLLLRHVRHGRSEAAAREWIDRSDQANARLIESTRHRATLCYRMPS